MELRVSSPKAAGLSPSDCASDPEEKEISDDDDEDRNHKHRRRETRSQSLERDPWKQVLVRPYRKRNRPFENGHPYRENDSQSSETWKSYNIAPLDKDLSAKFEKRRPGLATFVQPPNRVNQSSAELVLNRGRGRETGSWSQRDPRYGSLDIASQMIPQGSVGPAIFGGRGLSNVSNSQSASWSAFGLIPGMPKGVMDTIHSLGMQGTFRPSISPPLNMGIPRQRCRDFEERGFCLRGDMCPMEHGVNRIVVEDVQSLSQFNLPVSLPSAHLLGTPSNLPSVGAHSSTVINSKSSHGKSGKPGMVDDTLGMNNAFNDAGVGGADFYDPDQPLWTNDCPETSAALLGLNSSKLGETESLLEAEHSKRLHVDGSNNEHLARSAAPVVGCQSMSQSVWGRVGTKSKFEIKEKLGSTITSSNYIENEAREDQGLSANLHGTVHQGKQIISKENAPQTINSSLKTQGGLARSARKPSQKALRTLFVNNIPLKDNKKEALLLHFQKFGEVVDIYIPQNSERAFVQFSRREEAEAALKAPDAVMGNRFIKLWWANRDSIADDGTGGGIAAVSVSPHTVAQRGKDNMQTASPKVAVSNPAGAALPGTAHPMPVVSSPRAPPLQKKLENLELLKEELRKKQELLDQKRNDFRRQLDKLEKQSTGLKGEVTSDHVTKRQKTAINGAQVATPGSADSGAAVTLAQSELMVGKGKSVENVMKQNLKLNTTVTTPEPSIRPSVSVGAPFVVNRFKLDNRPTAFKILPPLPAGLANIAVLKEHFSAYGEVSTIELEDMESSDSDAYKNCSAHVFFTTRRSAELAFANGKSWQGHNLQFVWKPSTSNSSNENSVRENPASASKNSQKVAASGREESEKLDKEESGGDHMEQDEDPKSRSSTTSCEEVS